MISCLASLQLSLQEGTGPPYVLCNSFQHNSDVLAIFKSSKIKLATSV